MKRRLLDQFRKEKEREQKGGLYHQTQIKLAYNSNRIEDGRLSEDQARYIFETNTIAVKPNETADVDDIIETVNHFACFDYMHEPCRRPAERIFDQGAAPIAETRHLGRTASLV